MKTSSQRTRPQLKAKKRMNSRMQRASSPGVGGQRNPRSSFSGWGRPQGSSGSVSSHGNLLIAARRDRLAVGGWLEPSAAGARTVGTGFSATWPRARPTRLPAEPGRSRSRPASRYGSLRASAAVVFCPVEDGCQGRRLRMVLSVSAACRGMGRNQGCGTCEAPGAAKDRGLLGGLGADLGRPLWLSLARWSGLRLCRQPAFRAALPRRAEENAGGIPPALGFWRKSGGGRRIDRSSSGSLASSLT